MDLLVDTQAALWWLADSDRLSARARAVIAEPAHRVLVSAASLWEAAIKRALGKLEAPADLPDILVSEGFELLAVAPEHAWAVSDLPPAGDHRDPFDRLLVAQALTERLELVSPDAALDAYGVARHW